MAVQTFFRKLTHKSVWLPDYVTSSVAAIPIQVLVDSGIRHMVLDIDDTLVPFGGNKLDATYIHYLKQVKKAHITLTIGSNTRRDIGGIAQSIGADVIPQPWWSYKPMKAFYKTILAQTAEPPEVTAMVGDRVINDVVAANRAGLVTILTNPMGRRRGWLSRLYAKYLTNH
ncbi:MAG TPA: HAD hydrolase-like protein [Candidatus Saccharimonadales bacterium]|nr:HAD hydrolase-like protein [Candidatus Saccharimonadales bacterium]